MSFNRFFTFFINFLRNYFFIFLGFILFSIYIFFRFIRERVPKDIPFNLSVLGFFILIEICLIYAFIVWKELYPSKKPNEIIEFFSYSFFSPLDNLDSFIKSLPLIKTYYPKMIFWIAYKCEYYFKTPIFEIIFYFFPRILLLSTFMIDIFYFSKLFFIYKILLLGILLFLRRYILYSIKKFKTEYLKELKLYIRGGITQYEFGVHPSEWPENYDPDDEDNDEIPPTMHLSLEIYVDYYTRCTVYRDFKPCIQHMTTTTAFFEKYKDSITIIGNQVISHVNSEVYINEQLHREKLKKNLEDLLQAYVFYEYYNKMKENSKYIKNMKILLFSLYLICWVYILIVSFHTLNLFELIEVLNKTWLNIENPFSELNLKYDTY